MPNKKKKLIDNQSMMKSSINKALKERDALMLSLDKKIQQAKIREEKIRKEIKNELKIAKEKDKQLKAKNKSLVEKQKAILRTKKEAVKIKDSSFKKSMQAVSADINIDISLNKKKTNEKLRGIKFAQKSDLEKRKKEKEKIKLEAIEAKYKIAEKRRKAIETRKKIKQERIKVLSEEKIAIAKAKVQLSNLRFQKKKLEAERREEKLEKARQSRLEEEQAKEDAKLRYQEEISSIKYGKVSKRIEISKDIEKERKELKEEERKEKQLNTVFNENKLSAESQEMKADSPQTDMDIEYSMAFEETSDSTKEYKNEITTSIEGISIKSFGRKGAKKYKLANKDAVEDDIAKYKRTPELFKAILAFKEIDKKKEWIHVNSFRPYLELLLDQKISIEKFTKFQSYLIQALLTKHAIQFADGYIEAVPSRKRNITRFTKQIINSNLLVSFDDRKLEKEVNALVLKKLKSGGSLKIAKGLIATMQSGKIVILQDTNFIKA